VHKALVDCNKTCVDRKTQPEYHNLDILACLFSWYDNDDDFFLKHCHERATGENDCKANTYVAFE